MILIFYIRLNPFLIFIKKDYHRPILMMACTPQLFTLFYELNHDVTSSPLLTQFDPDKPNFLRIYWSSEGMVCILMQRTTDI